MSDLGYHRVGTLPDVALGPKNEVLITRLGTWEPVFDLSPDEAEAHARRVLWVVARAREDAAKPSVPVGTVEPRHFRAAMQPSVVELASADRIGELPSARRVEPFTFARPPAPRGGAWLGLGMCALSAALVLGAIAALAWWLA